jgi:hypothetical protein
MDGGQNENPSGSVAQSVREGCHSNAVACNYYEMRAEAATGLCFAIAECHPEDAILIMGAALTDLRNKAAFEGNKYFREAVMHYRGERQRTGRVV